jgi:hypothetical protein
LYGCREGRSRHDLRASHGPAPQVEHTWVVTDRPADGVAIIDPQPEIRFDPVLLDQRYEAIAAGYSEIGDTRYGGWVVGGKSRRADDPVSEDISDEER